MPILTLPIALDGPTVDVFVGVSQPRRQALLAASLPVPAPFVARLLIDTGASCTAVDPTVFGALQIPQSGSCLLTTPSTGAIPHQCGLFDVSLAIHIPSQNVFHMLSPTLSVIESDLASQGILGLLGRDILNKCVLTYNGVGQNLILSM